ncbi:MAG TPA: hypothetical protein VLC47_02645 [Burkholderiales bacterium]|nr:hypothetical protein [Burkholderiales bacterium]
MAEPESDSALSAQRLRDEVARVRTLRDAARDDPVLGQDRLLVRAWQADRLARTYPDLLASPRYGPAAAFFLSDLYGPKDFSARDEALARIIPTMTRMLPAAALATIALAVELDALSEALDQRVAAELRRRQPGAHALELGEASYADAYRAAGSAPERQRQIWLVGNIGAALDKLARKPLVAGALRVMETPARAAGLGALHEFLARGFAAFHGMRGADEFLAVIAARESRISARLFADDPRPFDTADS